MKALREGMSGPARTRQEQEHAVAAQNLAATEQAQADWTTYDKEQTHAAELRDAVTQLGTTVLLTEGERAKAERRLDDLDQLKGWVKRRARHDREAARSRLEAAREESGKAEKREADAEPSATAARRSSRGASPAFARPDALQQAGDRAQAGNPVLSGGRAP
ncbi:hypothetical protein AB0D83_08455 [Streptomyces decoyicus]|uniref:hypothetical protein n=1 Tax=Streptomyces decoyicus TaxID=249567 RepID=UPI0033C0CD7F